MEAAARKRGGSGQTLPALIACVIWAGGFELAPALHAFQHAELAPHSHGGETHTHHGDDDAPERHGEGSLAHRGLAALTPPPALPPFDRPRLEVVRWECAPPTARGSARASRPRARAPPLARS